MEGGKSVLISRRSCIFCSKAKYQRNSRKKEKLADCIEFRADSTIKKTALARKDDKILVTVMSKDLISSEAKYHQSCYRARVRTNYVQPANESNTKNKDENDYKRIESQAFEIIIEYCTGLIEQPRLVYRRVRKTWSSGYRGKQEESRKEDNGNNERDKLLFIA